MTVNGTARLDGNAAGLNATPTAGIAGPKPSEQPCRRSPASDSQLGQLPRKPTRQPAGDLGEPRSATVSGEMRVRRASLKPLEMPSSHEEPSAKTGQVAGATDQPSAIRDRFIDAPERLKVHVRTMGVDHSSDADSEDWDYDVHLVRDPMRAQALQKALSTVLDPAVRPLPLAQHMSLGEIARNAGVVVADLEPAIKDFLAKFSEDTANSSSWSFTRNAEAFADILCNLQRLSNQHPLAVPWLQHMRGFDAFVDHFCPQADKGMQSKLIKIVEYFIDGYHPPMLLKNQDLEQRRTAGANKTGAAVYGGHGPWVKLPGAWVDRRVIEEALALAQKGIPKNEGLFAHGTGSAAMGNFAKYQAISSAAVALQRGDKVMTGEYANWIERDGQTSATGGRHGLGEVYASLEGISSDMYTKQRWFDESPVTFGISERKQRAYNDALNIKRTYRCSGEGITGEGVLLGPNVPLGSVVAISAPKEHEARIRGWIADHCPHAQFVSYEAATLLEHRNMFGLLS